MIYGIDINLGVTHVCIGRYDICCSSVIRRTWDTCRGSLSLCITNEYQKQERAENRPLWYSGRDICWHTVRTINKYCLFAVGQKGRYKSSQFPRYVHALQVFSLSQGNRLCQKPGKGLYKLHPHFAHFPGVLRYDHSVMIVSYWLTKAGSTQSKAMLSRVEEIIFFHISNYMLLQNILK